MWRETLLQRFEHMTLDFDIMLITKKTKSSNRYLMTEQCLLKGPDSYMDNYFIPDENDAITSITRSYSGGRLTFIIFQCTHWPKQFWVGAFSHWSQPFDGLFINLHFCFLSSNISHSILFFFLFQRFFFLEKMRNKWTRTPNRPSISTLELYIKMTILTLFQKDYWSNCRIPSELRDKDEILYLKTRWGCWIYGILKLGCMCSAYWICCIFYIIRQP